MVIELELLTVLYEHGLARRRSAVWSFALSSVLAIGWGMVGSVAAGWVQRSLGVQVFGGMGATSAAITAQVGAFDGVVGLGLWAVAIVIPHAVREANARAHEVARSPATTTPR